MDTTERILFPPNFQIMSDVVIRSVKERSHPRQHFGEDPNLTLPRYELPFLDRLRHSMDTSERSCRSHEPAREFSNLIPTTEKKTKGYLSADVDPGFEAQPVAGHTKRTKNKNQTRLSVYQRRYRAKRDAYRITLENKTRQLQMEIKRLKRLKVQRAKDTLWAMVVEYFSLLRQSVQSGSSLSSLNAVHNADRLVMKRTFHHNNMMMCCLPRYFDHVDVELQHLKRSTRNTVIATTVTSFIITGRTLAKVFPHLCNRDGRHGGAIATRLLHKRVVMHGWARFERDDTTPHV